MVSIRNPPEWSIEPVPPRYRFLRGIDYFVLWSSLGVGLLVFSAGSFLTAAKFSDAILAIIIGSIAGSLLLALAGKIGSDHAVPSLISARPSFGIQGSYLPAILNVMQLIGWTTFEIMIMSKAAEMLAGRSDTILCLDDYYRSFCNTSWHRWPTHSGKKLVGKICHMDILCIINNHNHTFVNSRKPFKNIIIIRQWQYVFLLGFRYCDSYANILDATCGRL